MDARTNREESRWEAIERVAEEARAEGTGTPPEKPAKLPPQSVEIEWKVFQQRTFEGPMAVKSMGHIDGLVEAIRHSPNHELDPIDIWWSGRRWIVVDGHHRLKAYRKVATDQKRPLTGVQVPVRVFEGTLDEALGRSAEGNVKDKLVMPEEQKSDLAWRFTCWGETANPRWTRKQIAQLSGRSKELVASMRKTRKRLVEMIEAGEVTETTMEGLMELSWDEARRLESGGGLRSWDEEQIDAAARAGAIKLRRAFKDTLAKNPEMCARILWHYDPELPEALMQSEPWWDIRAEMEKEEREAAEEEDAEDDF